ncbi:site-specific integrase [Muricomes intestini]|uniref:tyrosine-type recombinase/integrase n=1 Tax=Muricomes intestini TaxID=1796634 RepID=UPI002FDD2313
MWVEETKNGKYKAVERYTDYLTGKQKKVSVTMEKNTTQSRKVAQKALEAKIEEAMHEKPKKDYTLSELVKAYRADQKVTVKQSTYKRNYFAAKALMNILGKDTIVNRLSAKYVREKLRDTGKETVTLNEHLARFRALIRWGYHNDMVANISFLDKLEAFNDTPHREKIQDKFLESDELKSLLAVMDSEHWKLITQFLVFSGLRFGEAAALNLKRDIDLENNLIHVNETYDPINKVTTTPKTRTSVRDVYMQEELKEVCKKIKLYMLQQRLAYGYTDSGLFLSTIEGKHVSYYAYNKYLRENAQKTLGRGITAHTLRHTHASLLMEQGVSIDTISRRLGHENSQITREIYLHVTEKLKERDNEEIAKVKIM